MTVTNHTLERLQSLRVSMLSELNIETVPVAKRVPLSRLARLLDNFFMIGGPGFDGGSSDQGMGVGSGSGGSFTIVSAKKLPPDAPNKKKTPPPSAPIIRRTPNTPGNRPRPSA